MTKPQTAKDLVELYDEWCEYRETHHRTFDPDIFGFMEYLREQTEVVEEKPPLGHNPMEMGLHHTYQDCLCHSLVKSVTTTTSTPPLSPLTDKETIKFEISGILMAYRRGELSILKAQSELLALIKENSK